MTHVDSNKAKVVAFKGHKQLMQLMEVTIPALNTGEILVKNLYTTICGSDLHTYCGLRSEKTPTVLGHEIVGEIVSIEEHHSALDLAGNRLKVGDRVTWSIFSSNAQSALAKKGIPQKGDNLFKYGHAQITEEDALHGGLGTHCILKPDTAILKIDRAIPLPIAATINCAVATVAGAIRLAGDLVDKEILITGAGLLGIVCVAMCKEGGARSIHMADVNAQRLQQAKQFGADVIHLFGDNRLELTEPIDITFDMSGAPDAMELGLDSLGIGGMAIWIGAVLHTRKIQVDAERIIRRLITIKGLHNYNFDDFAFAVKFISENFQRYPFEKVVEKEFSLADAEIAFGYAVSNKPLRVGINMNANSPEK